MTADTRLIMPKKVLVEVKQIAEFVIEKVECEVKENHIYFNLGDRLLVARMVERVRRERPAAALGVWGAADARRAGRALHSGNVRWSPAGLGSNPGGRVW